jgi:deoxyribodipyrimidine photo-lyase
MGDSPVIVWLRDDLRLADQPAFAGAVARGGPIIPVYVWDPAGEAEWIPGAASRWWLHHSLARLGESIAARGGRLILREGDSADELAAVLAATGARSVYWCRRYEPVVVARDEVIAQRLRAAGVEVRRFDGRLLYEPEDVATQQGSPFQVFTPFWRKCQRLPVAEPGPGAPEQWPVPASWPSPLKLDQFKLMPGLPWAEGLAASHDPGEAGAWRRLREFLLEDRAARYATQRDLPAEMGTSRLSPHLHWGEISPRQVWAALSQAAADFPPSRGAEVFCTELGWREFAHHLLHHFPRTPAEPLRKSFQDFPWRSDPGGVLLKAWQDGRTGYPIVDAGMRELWATGWMHNRVRMVVASFLVKHLRLPWTAGAAWFWDTLVDADLAANTLGWQWSAGCGADAAPYFRIFAPVRQGEKFDGKGRYVRQWVPELAALPDKHLHAPWEASDTVREAAGVRLGETYPWPIVDHRTARAEALAAWRQLKEGTAA